ncbi:MAG: hypothetical protein JWR85_4209 [Marmoricola sp.]|nr:hypothetical protein [Marmoricola sp.]
MTPHKQLFRHKPPETYGDCARTVYACMLDIQPADVPHFGELYWDKPEEWRKAELDWFNSQGYQLLTLAYSDKLENIHGSIATLNPNVYYMLSGTSRNECNHLVICRNGEIVHDPAQDDSGIIGPCDDGYYWIYYIIPNRFSNAK